MLQKRLKNMKKSVFEHFFRSFFKKTLNSQLSTLNFFVPLQPFLWRSRCLIGREPKDWEHKSSMF